MTTRLTAGDPAPSFRLPDADGNEVALADFKGRRVVVYFYPAAMTPGCTKQAVDFTASHERWSSAGYDILGISPDKPEKLAKFREKESVNFPLLADPERTTLEAYGAYGEKMMYGKKMTGVIRSTFVIDVDDAGAGTVAEAQYNVRATGHVDKLLKELGIA